MATNRQVEPFPKAMKNRPPKDDPRTGIIICHCGDDIAGVLDINRIIRSVKKMPGIRYVAGDLFPCSRKSLEMMKKTVADHGLDRVVIAGCTPRTHAPLFRKTLAEAGLRGNSVEMVNIREQCSRVHAGDPGQATDKAIVLIRMAIARSSRSVSAERIRSRVEPAALVVGGGISGMTAALSLAQRRVPVHLVEKEARLGGLIHTIYRLYPAFSEASRFLQERIQAVESHPSIHLYLSSRVSHVSGHVGDYRVTIEQEGTEKILSAGVAIIATGSDVLEPAGMYGYGRDPRVITQHALEEMMRRGKVKAQRMVMIQCVGARIDERPYCSRHCCLATIMNAIMLKEKSPQIEITVLFRGLTEHIQEFEQAQEMGIRFIRYDPPAFPEVTETSVAMVDGKTGERHTIPGDLVVLATPLVPRAASRELARMFRIPVDELGFLVEHHTKLRPGQHVPSGAFVAGAAHWPAIVSECIDQGHGAAGRALAFLQAGFLEKEPIISNIAPEQCRGCGRCAEACPTQAIELEKGEDGIMVARSDELLCTGCGICASICICGAVTMCHLLDDQLNAVLETATHT